MFGQNEYTVECITNKRLIRGRTQYLVKWLNYSEEDSTWQPMSNLANVMSLIRQYEERMENQKKESIRKTRLIRKQRRLSSIRRNDKLGSQKQKIVDQKLVQKPQKIKKEQKQKQKQRENVTKIRQIPQQSLIEIQIIGQQQNNSQLLPFLEERNQGSNNDFSDAEKDIQVLQMRIVNEERFFEVQFANEVKWLSNQIMKRHYSRELIEFYENHINID